MYRVAAGFSGRSQDDNVQQFPLRDGEGMSDLQPGFSNSKPAKGEDVDDQVDAKVIDGDDVEDKAVAKPRRSRSK